jgi:hypothetical protein
MSSYLLQPDGLPHEAPAGSAVPIRGMTATEATSATASFVRAWESPENILGS